MAKYPGLCGAESAVPIGFGSAFRATSRIAPLGVGPEIMKSLRTRDLVVSLAVV